MRQSFALSSKFVVQGSAFASPRCVSNFHLYLRCSSPSVESPLYWSPSPSLTLYNKGFSILLTLLPMYTLNEFISLTYTPISCSSRPCHSSDSVPSSYELLPLLKVMLNLQFNFLSRSSLPFPLSFLLFDVALASFRKQAV